MIEIDQSGKVEVLNTETVVAFSNGLAGAVRIKAAAKRRLFRGFHGSLIPHRDVPAIIFSFLVFLLIEDKLPANMTLRIDEEYSGKEDLISRLLEELLISKHGKKWVGSIRFARIGKHSRAHLVAWRIHGEIKDYSRWQRKLSRLIF